MWPTPAPGRRTLARAALALALLGGAARTAGAGTMEPFGPWKLVRAAGPPAVTALELSNCEPQARFELVVVNGDAAGAGRISSGWIRLNGVEVVGPADLNQRVARVARPVAVGGDDRLEVELAGAPGGFVTVSVECTAGCLEVAIEAPASGGLVAAGAALVSGRVSSGAPEVGVEVNGVPAAAEEGRFAAAPVPLAPGANRLEAVAVNACRQRASAAVEVTAREETDTALHLLASPAAGAAPLPVLLSAALGPAALGAPVAAVEWDFDGDGTADATSPTLAAVEHVYPGPGLFLPRVTVVDAQGNRWSEVALVQALDPGRLAVLAQGKWNALRERLAGADVAGALDLLATSRREAYGRSLAALSQALPQVAEALAGELALHAVRERKAVFTTRAVTGGVETEVWMELVQDADGLWRIGFF